MGGERGRGKQLNAWGASEGEAGKEIKNAWGASEGEGKKYNMHGGRVRERHVCFFPFYLYVIFCK